MTSLPLTTALPTARTEDRVEPLVAPARTRAAYPVLLAGLCASVAGYAVVAVLAVRLLAQLLA